MVRESTSAGCRVQGAGMCDMQTKLSPFKPAAALLLLYHAM